MEHFSTHPDVFFKLYEEASEKTRLLCMDQMTKRQIAKLKYANKFKFKSEIKKAKMINPKAFSVSEFSEDDFYNISLEAVSATDKDYIRKVKHLTKKKLDEWIEYHSDDRYDMTTSTLGYIKYSTAYFLLKTKMLSEEQVAIVILSDMEYLTTNKSLVKVAEEFGCKLSDETVALYYLRNTSYCEFDFLDENGQELRDRVFTSVIKMIKEDEIKYNKFVYYLRVMMGVKKNKKEWEAILDLFNNYPSYDDLFGASWKNEKVIASVTNHINNGDFDIKFLDDLGFNIFPKSQRLFLGV